MKNLFYLLLGLILFAQNSSHLNAQCLVPAMSFSSSSSTATSITVNYAVVPGASWYEFQYKPSSSGTWINGGTSSSGITTKTISGLTSSTSYDVRGRSFCSNGTPGVWSTTLTQSTQAPLPCELPAVLSTTTITHNSVSLSWPSISGAAWYEFRYKLVSSGTWISGGTQLSPGTTKTINGLNAYSNYEVQTRTFCNGTQFSNWSTSTLFTTTISPPTLAASTVNSNNATVTWSVVPNALWYEFRVQAGGTPYENAGSLTGTGTTKTFTGLGANTNHNIQARSVGPGFIASPWSTVLTITTVTATDCQVPPTIAATTIGGNNVTITWPAVNLAAWYEFEYKESSSSTWIPLGTSNPSITSRTISGLNASTAYNLRARTYCADGLPSNWRTINFTTLQQNGCEIPPSITIDSILSNSTYFSWPSIANAAWFEFRYKESSSPTWISAGTLTGTGTQKVLSGLNSSTTYDFQARSFCSNNIPSAWSTTIQFNTGSMAIAQNHDVEFESNDILEKYNNINREHPIKVYPNPTSDFVTVTYRVANENAVISIRLIDMTGRIVQSIETSGTEGENIYKLDLTSVQSGIYSLEYYVDNNFVQRLNVRKE